MQMFSNEKAWGEYVINQTERLNQMYLKEMLRVCLFVTLGRNSYCMFKQVKEDTFEHECLL